MRVKRPVDLDKENEVVFTKKFNTLKKKVSALEKRLAFLETALNRQDAIDKPVKALEEVCKSSQ